MIVVSEEFVLQRGVRRSDYHDTHMVHVSVYEHKLDRSRISEYS